MLIEADLVAAWSINEANVPAVGAETLESLLSIFSESEVALGAFDGGSLVGFCLVLPPGSSYESPNYRYFCDRYADFAYIDRVAFLGSHQGSGWGTKMYREVEKMVGRTPLALEVNVVPPNEGSMRFHLREGFTEVDRLETRPGKLVSLMIKHLPTGN